MKLIWATRGRTWGFRFLLDGGYRDPYPAYISAFEDIESVPAFRQIDGAQVALRFADPLGRQDESGRIIPHDIVVAPPLAEEINCVDDGTRMIWPQLADAYASVWELSAPPTTVEIESRVKGAN